MRSAHVTIYIVHSSLGNIAIIMTFVEEYFINTQLLVYIYYHYNNIVAGINMYKKKFKKILQILKKYNFLK